MPSFCGEANPCFDTYPYSFSELVPLGWIKGKTKGKPPFRRVLSHFETNPNEQRTDNIRGMVDLGKTGPTRMNQHVLLSSTQMSSAPNPQWFYLVS